MSKVFLIGESLNKFNQAIQWLKNKNRERVLNRKISKIIDDQKKISDYLVKEYLNPYLSSEGLDLSISQEREKIIWQYWNAGLEEAPAIVKASIDSVRKNLPDGYRHVILCDKNIHEYVDIPDWVKDKYLNNRSFRATFFSDVLRLLLLEKYGGVWVDATIFMSSEIPSHVLNSPFFVFYRGLEPSDSKIYEKFNPMYFSWRPDFKVRLCSSFIISNKSHPFVSALKWLLLKYWRDEDKVRHYFILQILFEELVKSYPYSGVSWDYEDDLNIHRMLFEVKKKYNKNDWRRLCSACFVHKLTYYRDADIGSFYKCIENM